MYTKWKSSEFTTLVVTVTAWKQVQKSENQNANMANNKQEEFVLSLDVGTTNIRAFIYDQTGAIRGHDNDKVSPKNRFFKATNLYTYKLDIQDFFVLLICKKKFPPILLFGTLVESVSRFFVQVGHETTHAAVENHQFFTVTGHLQSYQNYQKPL